METGRDEKQYIKMTQTPISVLVSKLAIPTTISMLITSIYSLADTFFVSQLSTSASSAVGIVFSLQTIVQAVGFTLGMGSGSLLARRLGEKDKKAADTYASTAFFTALAIGVIIMITGLLFTPQIMRMLGATETNIGYTIAYGNYIIWGVPFICASFVLNNILRSEGKATLSMIGLCTGGILNIILDPIFIFTFGMETAGAALATLISQAVSFVILIAMFLFKKSNINLSIKNVSLKPKHHGKSLSQVCRHSAVRAWQAWLPFFSILRQIPTAMQLLQQCQLQQRLLCLFSAFVSESDRALCLLPVTTTAQSVSTESKRRSNLQ